MILNILNIFSFTFKRFRVSLFFLFTIIHYFIYIHYTYFYTSSKTKCQEANEFITREENIVQLQSATCVSNIFVVLQVYHEILCP